MPGSDQRHEGREHDRRPTARHQPRERPAEPRGGTPDAEAPRFERGQRGGKHDKRGRPAAQDPDAADQTEVPEPAKICREQRGVGDRRGQRGGQRPAQAALHGRAQSRRRVGVAAALLEIAREQDDAEIDAVSHDDRRQERGRQIQMAHAEAREGERHQRPERERARAGPRRPSLTEEEQHAEGHDREREHGGAHHAVQQRPLFGRVRRTSPVIPIRTFRAATPRASSTARSAAARTGDVARHFAGAERSPRDHHLQAAVRRDESASDARPPPSAASSCRFNVRRRSPKAGPVCLRRARVVVE